LSDRVDQILLNDIRTTLGGGRMLDLPAGRGVLSRQLAQVGFEVTPSDLFPESFCWEEGGQAEVVRADMNQRLPFADGVFDGVVCQEGVEHLENLAAFLRECRRVLRDGGHLWITTPNFMDLSSRLSYLLTGMKSFRAGFPNEETTVWGGDGERLYHGHAFTLPFFQIRYLLRVCQFGAIHLQGLGLSTTSVLLYPFVRAVSGVLISRAQRQHLASPKRRAASTETYQELRGHALARQLLLYKKILVRATLREGSFQPAETYVPNPEGGSE
jgi:2-polyprenyl-3-methyl-5-hydroxy-6-metoxy-1,4-benzoquinol methylase